MKFYEADNTGSESGAGRRRRMCPASNDYLSPLRCKRNNGESASAIDVPLLGEAIEMDSLN